MENCHDLLNGTLKLIQPEDGRGLRVNVDTVLLAHFTRPKKNEKILEIGCAHGAISLILAKRGFCVHGVDIEPHLIGLAKQNAELNGLEASFACFDIRRYRLLSPAQSWDRIVVNPPYNEAGNGWQSPSGPLSAALNGTCCTLEDIIAASHYLLKNRGRLDIVMRGERLGELFALLERFNTPPKKLLCVYPKPGVRAAVVLVEAMRSGRHGLSVEPPLFITGDDGAETEELKKAYVIGGCE